MLLAYSPRRLRYFWRTYRILIDTFGVFSDYGKSLLAYFRNTHKELRICRSKFAPYIMPADFKGTFRNNWMRPFILYKEQLTIFLSLVLKSNLLFGYMENTRNGKKSIEILLISAYNRTWDNFRSSLPTLGRVYWAKKPSHATVPLRSRLSLYVKALGKLAGRGLVSLLPGKGRWEVEDFGGVGVDPKTKKIGRLYFFVPCESHWLPKETYE